MVQATMDLESELEAMKDRLDDLELNAFMDERGKKVVRKTQALSAAATVEHARAQTESLSAYTEWTRRLVVFTAILTAAATLQAIATAMLAVG